MTNNTKRHIFLFEDQSKVLKVVSETLEELGIKISCFAYAAECLKQLAFQRCDLIIADVKMPEMDGIELLTEIKRLTPWLPVLVMAGNGDIQTAVMAIQTGAVDVIEKPLNKKSFLGKVKSILQQNTHITYSEGKQLTESEIRVLKLIFGGKSNTEIAYLLHRSVRTIEVHRSHLMHKLDVDNVVDLVIRAAMMGLVELPTN